MVLYTYRCAKDHLFDCYQKTFRTGSRKKCPKCGGFGKQTIASGAGPQLIGVQISDKTRKILSVPFGKKKAMAFKTVADVDKAFADFENRYKHFGNGMSHPKDTT